MHSKTYTQRVYSVTEVELELLVKKGVCMDSETHEGSSSLLERTHALFTSMRGIITNMAYRLFRQIWVC